MTNTELAQELHEAFRREVARRSELPDLSCDWTDLSTRDKHLWKGVADRLAPVLEGARP